MAPEQEIERRKADAPTVIGELERAGVPPFIRLEIGRLGQTHKLAIEFEYAEDGTTADRLTVRDADTGETLLHEDFAAFRTAEMRARTLGDHVDKEEPRITVVPDNIELSLLRGTEGERGS